MKYKKEASGHRGATLFLSPASCLAFLTIFILSLPGSTEAQSLGESLDNTALVWTTNGNVGWAGQGGITHDGVDTAASGLISHDEASALETIVAGPGTLTFWWKVSSEEAFDFLGLYVGTELEGVGEVARLSGEVDWQRKSVVIPNGPHLVQWAYIKDASENDGQDRAWLDEVTFVPATVPLIIAQPIGRTVTFGSEVTLSVLSAGPVPLEHQWYFKGTNTVADATNATLTLSPIQQQHAGDYRVVVSNSFGVVTSAVARIVVISLGEALDNTNLVWNTFTTNLWEPGVRTYLWQVDKDSSHDGRDSVRSGPIDYDGAVLETTVFGPGTVGFWWKVSSHECCEFLRFHLGTNIEAEIKGAVDWEYRTVSIPPGLQTLRWEYADFIEGIAWNRDAAWVDQVTFAPAGLPPTIGSQPDSRTVLANTDVSFTPSVVGDSPLHYQWHLNGATALVDATNATLTLNQVQVSDAGSYQLVASNTFGSRTSRVARLRVLAPAVRGVFDTSGDAWDVAVAGDRAFVADGLAGLRILDVSDPANIVHLGSYDTPGFARQVKLSGALAYVADSEAGLQILDVSNPANIVLLSSYSINSKAAAYGVELVAERAYLAYGAFGLKILDVSNPANAVRIGSHLTAGEAFDVRVKDGAAFVGAYAGMHVLDVAQPSNVFEKIFFPSPQTQPVQAIQVIGDRAYWADSNPGDHEITMLHVLDAREVSNTARLANYTSIGSGDFVHLHVAGDFAYLGQDYQGLQIVELIDPSRMRVVGNNVSQSYAHGIRSLGNRLYVAAGDQGLKILEIGGLPSAQPIFVNAQFDNGEFRANLGQMQTPATIVFEASVDLTHWTPIRTNLVTNQPFPFTAPTGNVGTNRFFRAAAW
jgi:hypothetical protein